VIHFPEASRKDAATYLCTQALSFFLRAELGLQWLCLTYKMYRDKNTFKDVTKEDSSGNIRRTKRI
jgi:hypothetical protein